MTARWAATLAALRAELLELSCRPARRPVDALSLVGQLLDRIGPGQKLKLPEAPRRVDYRPALTRGRPTAGRRCNPRHDSSAGGYAALKAVASERAGQIPRATGFHRKGSISVVVLACSGIPPRLDRHCGVSVRSRRRIFAHRIRTVWRPVSPARNCPELAWVCPVAWRPCVNSL
jgi:hypothetical protein